MGPLWRERAGVVPNLLAFGYAASGYAFGFVCMARDSWLARGAGVLLTTHAMLIAAYLLHEAMHQTLFRRFRHNRSAGEALSFIAGGSYASFERMRDLHLRHHRERIDVGCFDYKAFLARQPVLLRRIVFWCEWAYLPAIELLMHLQVIVRPFVRTAERAQRGRVLVALAVRLGALALIAWRWPSAAALYLVAYGLLLVLLGFFDAFHHTYEQRFVAHAHAPLPESRRDRAYEQHNTYSNLLSRRYPALNLLVLNFCYHNAHHERAGVPWYRLPALHRSLGLDARAEVLPVSELLQTFHANRLRRIFDSDYGALGAGRGRADGFVGAHGVSFLSVV